MALFTRQPPTRAQLLAQASSALGRGDQRKALRLYQRVLEASPDDQELHARIAPLLAERGHRGDAWQSYRRAAEHHVAAGFAGKAIALYRQAVEKLPTTVEAWERLAELQVERGQDGEALRVLADGCRRFGWRRWRSRMLLLERAHALNPRNPEIVFRLAPLLTRAGQRDRALEMLAALDGLVARRELRRLRGLAARIRPTPLTGWRWLRAVVAGR